MPETLRRVARVPEVGEIIVVDGGSNDETIAVAKAMGARVISHGGGRGVQLRVGAEASQGEIVLMLHADTWLPPDAGRTAIELLNRPGVVAGGYLKRFRDDVPWMMRGARMRCRLLLGMYGYIYGDQGFFLKRSTLDAIGGVPPVPLMEELELSNRLWEIGRLELADATVITAWRKFEKLGILRTYLLMWQILRAYRSGVSLDELRRIYQGG